MIELDPIWMRGLLPSEGRCDFGALVEGLLREPPAGDPPYLACNFISTLDGRATMGGDTSQLGFHADGRALMRLRTFADAVMVGAGTLRVERYGRILPEPRLRQYREQIGLAPEPLTVIVTESMRLPWDSGLFSEGHGTVLVATTSADTPPATETLVEVLRFPDRVSMEGLLEHLHRERDVGSVLCEGGPTVLNELVKDGLVDDLFLTLNPVLVGSGERSLAQAPLQAPVPAEVAWVLEAEGELFTRWRLGRAASKS